MGVKRYRARRSQKGILKFTANGHYDFKFKRLKYVGLAKGLQDAANVDFVFKTVNRLSTKLNKDLLLQREELLKYTNDALHEQFTKIKTAIAVQQNEMQSFLEDYVKKFEIKTAQHVSNENKKIKKYVDNTSGRVENKIQELTQRVHWLEHDLYPTHENKTTSALSELKQILRKDMDDISKRIEEIRSKVFKPIQ